MHYLAPSQIEHSDAYLDYMNRKVVTRIPDLIFCRSQIELTEYLRERVIIHILKYAAGDSSEVSRILIWTANFHKGLDGHSLPFRRGRGCVSSAETFADIISYVDILLFCVVARQSPCCILKCHFLV